MQATTIAKWILLFFNNKERVDELKVECLLYYAQGLSYRIFNKPLFEDEIMKWSFGPIVWTVAHEYKNDFWGDISITWSNKDLPILSKENIQVLDTLFVLFSNLSSWELLEMIEKEEPYLQTKEDDIILKEDIRDFFQSSYLDNYYFRNKNLKYSEEYSQSFEKFKSCLKEEGII